MEQAFQAGLLAEEPTLEGRTASITIGGTEYLLVLTTGATRKISTRYGGLEKLGEKLMNGEDTDKALGEVIWLVTLLANQGILIHNHTHPEERRDLLTEELVELLTRPAELPDYRDAITAAMVAGTRRDITSQAPVGKDQD